MEDVRITLLSAPGAKIGNPYSAVVNIIDNTGTVEFTATVFIVDESSGIAQIPVRRTGRYEHCPSQWNIRPIGDTRN